jgi:hypothetical protein
MMIIINFIIKLFSNFKSTDNRSKSHGKMIPFLISSEHVKFKPFDYRIAIRTTESAKK